MTIPDWLNNMAEKNSINFAQTLQKALMEKLHIHNILRCFEIAITERSYLLNGNSFKCCCRSSLEHHSG